MDTQGRQKVFLLVHIKGEKLKTLLSILAILLLMLYVIPNSIAWDWDVTLDTNELVTEDVVVTGTVGDEEQSYSKFLIYGVDHVTMAWARIYLDGELVHDQTETNPSTGQTYNHWETQTENLDGGSAQAEVSGGTFNEASDRVLFHFEYPY